MHDDFIAIDDLDHDVEGRRRLAFENGFLGTASPCLFVRKGDGLNAAHQVGQRRIEHQVFEGITVSGAYQLHTALGDRAGSHRFQLGAYLVDHYHLRHVVFDRLDHYVMLGRGRRNLHATSAPDRGVRDVAIPGNLVAGVNDNDALAKLIGEHPRSLPEQRGFADSRPPQQQHTLARFNQVTDDRDRAIDGPSDPAGKADDLASAITDCRNAMECALDPGSVVVAEIAYPAAHKRKVFARHVDVGELDFIELETGRWRPPEIHNDLDQGSVLVVRQQVGDLLRDMGRENSKQVLQVIGNFELLTRECSVVRS